SELRGADSNRPVPHHRLDKIFKPRLISAGVGIDERDERSLGNLESCRVTSGEALVFAKLNDLHLGKILPGKPDGVVGRAVINQDDFATGIALARKSPQAFSKKSFSIPVNNDNAYLIVLLFSMDHPLPR